MQLGLDASSLVLTAIRNSSIAPRQPTSLACAMSLCRCRQQELEHLQPRDAQRLIASAGTHRYEGVVGKSVTSLATMPTSRDGNRIDTLPLLPEDQSFNAETIREFNRWNRCLRRWHRRIDRSARRSMPKSSRWPTVTSPSRVRERQLRKIPKLHLHQRDGARAGNPWPISARSGPPDTGRDHRLGAGSYSRSAAWPPP